MTFPDQHFRPQYHFSPPANWLNDPNGLVYYLGEYHLFYQYHPGSTVWGPMHWGHAVSSDLIHWQHLPIALYPDENGMIYSGSAVIDWHNSAGFGKEAMVAFFTHHQKEQERQSLAYSTDQGRTWSKYSGNPVILPLDNLRDFRDPKVFWYGENGEGHWIMVLAAFDSIRFYTSPDLINWQPGGSFEFDQGTDIEILETPDLFKLPVEGCSQSRWVLTAGVGNGGPGGKSGMLYFVGEFDGQTFASENSPDTILWMDFGADYYAAQSWSDEPHGRRVMIGWQNNWQYAHIIPTTTWRGIFSIPRKMSLRQTKSGIRLYQMPIAELCSLRGEHAQWRNLTISPGTNLLADRKSDSFEIEAEFQLDPAVEYFGFQIRVGVGERTTVAYDVDQEQVILDRSNSGLSSFDDGFARLHSASMAQLDGKIRLKILVDRSSVEVFGNNGEVVLSDTIFPAEQSQGLELFTYGGEIRLNVLDFYELRPANFTI